jgi:hypothetical protein
MVVYHHGTDDEWETKLREQQQTLIASAIRTEEGTAQ